jgi:ribosomal protein S8
MHLKVFYNNIARINHGIILNYSYINLKYSKYCLQFINFLYINGLISNYIVKDSIIIVFLKYSKNGTVLKKINLESKIPFWRWYRYKRLISKKSLFLLKYKQSELNLIILHTSKGFLFFETAYFLGIGGHFVCQIKV